MVLYHASQSKQLKVILPKRTLSNDKYIGDYVFATANRALAAMYLVPKGFAILMNIDMRVPTLVICGDEQELKKHDKGGAIYELLPDTFIDTPQQGLELYEKVSKKPVTPLKTKLYDSIFDAFREQEVKVKFVGETTFKELIESPNQKSLIQEL